MARVEIEWQISFFSFDFTHVSDVRHMLLFNLFLFLMLFIIYYSVLVYSPFKNEI